jgi:pimeloyl-ACP methyl ester carboxylesterase
MTTPAGSMKSRSSVMAPAPATRFLSRPGGRIGYVVAGNGSLVVVVPGMGGLRAACRLLAPVLWVAGCRVGCIDLGGLGDSDAAFMVYGGGETAADVVAVIEAFGGPGVVVGNFMGAGSAVLAAAQRPGLVCGLVVVGPFVRDGKTSAMQRFLLRVAMAPRWAAVSWKSYLAKLYAGRRPADFGGCRDQVVASLRRPGYAKAFSCTTRTGHDPAQARLADVAALALVVMGEQDPGFPDPRAEADWLGRVLHAQVVMVPDAGRYPQCQRPGIITAAVLCFLESVNGRGLGLDSATPAGPRP